MIVKIKNKKQDLNLKLKPGFFKVGLCYIYGLVSTGNQIPYTILKRIFANQKIFANYFIHILFIAVDKAGLFFSITNKIKNNKQVITI